MYSGAKALSTRAKRAPVASVRIPLPNPLTPDARLCPGTLASFFWLLGECF